VGQAAKGTPEKHMIPLVQFDMKLVSSLVIVSAVVVFWWDNAVE